MQAKIRSPPKTTTSTKVVGNTQIITVRTVTQVVVNKPIARSRTKNRSNRRSTKVVKTEVKTQTFRRTITPTPALPKPEDDDDDDRLLVQA